MLTAEGPPSDDLVVSLTLSTIGVLVLGIGLVVAIKKEHTITRVIMLFGFIVFTVSLAIRYNHWFG